MSLLALVLACAPDPEPEPEPAVELVVLAAASLTDALPQVAAAYEARRGVAVTFGFDGSARLARQVEAGAPADLLLTADRETMDRVDPLLLPGTRRDLLGNALVLVVPAEAAWAPSSPAELADPALRHLALAGEQVPAGRYARAALDSARVWTAVEPKVVRGDDVRTTLAWVSRGEAQAGVVYATDARIEPSVRVAFGFPPESHPPIVYPAAVVATSGSPDEARAFLDFCASEEGLRLFAAAGFSAPPP